MKSVRSSTTLSGIGGIACMMLAGSASFAQAPLGPAKSDSPVSLENNTGFVTLDLTKQDDKASPTIRLGYQTLLGDAVRRMRAETPNANIHGAWYYSLNLIGTPSDDIASLFGDGRVSTGADLQLSFGQAYLFSYASPRNFSVIEGLLGNLQNLTEQIAEERLKDAPDAAVLERRRVAATKIRQRLEEMAAKARHDKFTAFDTLYQRAISYARSVADYASVGATPPSAAPDPWEIINLRGGPIYDSWFIRGGVNAGSATLFNSAQPFGEQFSDEDYTGYSVQAGYSVRFGGSFPVTFAVSGGLKRSSNVDELSSTEVTETQTFTSADGQTRRVTTRKRNGLVGEFKEATKQTGKVDLVLYPGLAAANRPGEDSRPSVAVDLFGRMRKGTPFVYGVGAYITEPGSPTSVYGGLNVYRADTKKLAIDLVAGFPF